MADFESAIARAKAELKAAQDEFAKLSHDATGIVPEVKKFTNDVQTDIKADTVQDQPTMEDLMATIANLRTEMGELKTRGQAAVSQLAQNAAVDFAQGGDPVPHNLHLDDGTVIKNFDGIATHIAVDTPATATSDATTTIKRVVAAYPVAPVPAKN